MKFFIVTSHGWSASNWTAHALNLNNKVLCVHSARVEIANHKDLQSNYNLKKNINQLQKGYLKRQERSIDELYDEIIAKGEADVYGSVHVLRMRDIPIIINKFGPPIKSFKLANVVRHPVDLVWSGYGQFKDLFLYDINELHWTSGKVVRQALEFSNYIGEKYNLNIGDYEVLSFFGACAVMESLKNDLDAYTIVEKCNNISFQGTFQMEKITTSMEEYKNFCIALDVEEVDELYLNKVFKTGIVNKHKADTIAVNSKERFEIFETWQKEVFSHFFRLHNLKENYEKFGYDFTFIE